MAVSDALFVRYHHHHVVIYVVLIDGTHIVGWYDTAETMNAEGYLLRSMPKAFDSVSLTGLNDLRTLQGSQQPM